MVQIDCVRTLEPSAIPGQFFGRKEVPTLRGGGSNDKTAMELDTLAGSKAHSRRASNLTYRIRRSFGPVAEEGRGVVPMAAPKVRGVDIHVAHNATDDVEFDGGAQHEVHQH